MSHCNPSSGFVMEALIDQPTARRESNTAYKGRNVIQSMSTAARISEASQARYDKRADIFLSTILLAVALTWWINFSPDPGTLSIGVHEIAPPRFSPPP